MSQTWECRSYRPGDENGIRDLYREVFHIDMSPQLWHWMYQLCPAGPAVIVVLEYQGRLAGHYAVQPREFWMVGQRCTAGIAVGTMLLPSIRSVSALSDLAQQAYLLCRQRGYEWLYAFPNDQAHRVRCALLGWRPLPEIVEWDGPLPRVNSAVADNVRTWSQMPGHIDFAPLFSEPAQRANPGSEWIYPARSTDWIRWRYFERPDSEYILHTLAEQQGVLGYAVTKRYTRDGVRYGHVLDWRMAANASDRTADLLTSVWRQLLDWNVERVSCWARGQTELVKWLTMAGLSMAGIKTNFCYFDLNDRHDALLNQASAWQVEMAESDRY